jgi:hypothetical protein
MLQSSAAVHGGNSGGMLLNGEGVVLGMVTSNVRHTPPPSSDDDMATRKQKEKATEEGSVRWHRATPACCTTTVQPGRAV